MKRSELEAMSGSELVTVFNGLRPEKPVKRFASHGDGVRRVLAALGETQDKAAEPATPKHAASGGRPAATLPEQAAPESKPEKPCEPPAAPVAAVAAPALADAAPAVESGERPSRVTAYAAAPGGKEPRPSSKRGLLLAELRGNGITIEEMIARFEWTKLDCRDALRLLGKQNGVGTTLGADARWRTS